MADEVLPSKGEEWSLNIDASTKKKFWWHKTYSVSIWANSLKLKCSDSDATDFDVWRAFIEFRINTVYKLCGVCSGPEQDADLKVCCYCAHNVHGEGCSVAATPEQMAWKTANSGFESHLVVCVNCDDIKFTPPTEHKPEPEGARRLVIRALNLADEYPVAIRQALFRLRKECEKKQTPELLEKVQATVMQHFQPHESSTLTARQRIANKGNGFGIVAIADIPRYTVVGVYPGYDDPLSGEHAKVGRPGPKYSLVDMNCADYFNRVFGEFQKCITPFINEPLPTEKSNCAWIQETSRPEGRLSVMSVRDIAAGEELLIGYGPLYPRDYPYNYDAYAYHLVDGHTDPPCFALWHWQSLDEKESEFVCYIGYDKDTDTYHYWETEEEAATAKAAAPAPEAAKQ
jgi:hypothetical protein